MEGKLARNRRRLRRKRGIRKIVGGTAERPRLTVFRSASHIYAQVIDDQQGVTLCEASTKSTSLRDGIGYGGNVAAAKIIGKAIAEKALAKDIKAVCFDRNGYRYHGRLKALADAAREAGLGF
jgi:large subunit ribosomal protein L18